MPDQNPRARYIAILDAAMDGDPNAARELADAAAGFLADARPIPVGRAPIYTPSPARRGGTIEFVWLAKEPTPPGFLRLQDLHVHDETIDGELPAYGPARFRVASIALAYDTTTGMRTGKADVEILDD